MKRQADELIFHDRDEFRAWLTENAGTSAGVWLVFGKTAAVTTLSASEALEEALCFDWIDGQMKSVDETRYVKYFARRRTASVWSAKNKTLVSQLRERGLMATSGEQAVEVAVKNGQWQPQQRNEITTEQIEDLAERLKGLSPAYENFCAMSESVRRTYTRRYLSFKTEEARQRDFLKIVDRLNQNLKPM